MLKSLLEPISFLFFSAGQENELTSPSLCHYSLWLVTILHNQMFPRVMSKPCHDVFCGLPFLTPCLLWELTQWLLQIKRFCVYLEHYCFLYQRGRPKNQKSFCNLISYLCPANPFRDLPVPMIESGVGIRTLRSLLLKKFSTSQKVPTLPTSFTGKLSQ